MVASGIIVVWVTEIAVKQIFENLAFVNASLARDGSYLIQIFLAQRRQKVIKLSKLLLDFLLVIDRSLKLNILILNSYAEYPAYQWAHHWDRYIHHLGRSKRTLYQKAFKESHCDW